MRKVGSKAVVGIAAISAAAFGVVGCSADGGAAASGGEERSRGSVSVKAGTGSSLDQLTGAGRSAVGLTADGRLVGFLVNKPGAAVPLGTVKGLTGDTRLVAIDFRVQDGKLYGVGDQGGIYTVRTVGAKATKVGQLTAALQGQSFGVDFNPAANRLRVISDTGQNLRHNIDDPNGAPAAGTTAVDGTLTNPAPATGPALGVTAAAYTNNDLDATTATTLFDIDTTNDQVSVQSPANAGNLAPTGKLGVDAGAATGFDIHYAPRSGVNTAYAVINSKLYTVNLLTGKATSSGTVGGGRQVVDLALPIGQG
ncbi:DUF4394 domain-containing protein [Streptomyces sp. NPDC051940]|uniref:DUF4394 domain-containing protein n=1 Tax=Streptomyces sp. NPDC051940 TaxID=3155675 RepID=UPI00342983B0